MATYSNRFTKFGNKTKAQIDALSASYTLEQGDNVYNTDINKEEYWTGTNWINDDCVEVVNNAGATLSVGQLVGIDNGLPAATQATVEFADSVLDNWHIGVIYRGGINGAKVIVACKGHYKVKFTAATASVTRQHIAQLSGTVLSEATSTGSKVGGTGSIGVIAESFAVMPADRLVNCWINAAEAF